MGIWENLHDLFDTDDGSLPDIYVENLNDSQICKIYLWIRTLAAIYGEPTVWDNEEQRDVLIKCVKDPAEKVLSGRFQSFRHGIEEFKINNVRIPQLTVEVYPGGISFDYRMGPSWGENEIMSLFKFLAKIKDMAPQAKIFQTDEGGYNKPNIKFTEHFDIFYKGFWKRQY